MSSTTSTTERPGSSTKPVRWRSACNQCHAAKVRCSGERTGCDRCNNLQYQCVYAISRVGKVPGVRARGNKAVRTTTEALQRPETASTLPDADSNGEFQTDQRSENDPLSHSDFGEQDAAHDALSPKSHSALFPDWTEASDKGLNTYETADLFILPSQLMSSDQDPSRSRGHSLQAPSHSGQSMADSHTAAMPDGGLFCPFNKPTTPIPALPDLDLHIQDFHPMDVPVSPLDNGPPVKRRPYSDASCGHSGHSSKGYMNSTFPYGELLSQIGCQTDCGRQPHHYNYRSWTVLICNRIVEFLEHRIQGGVVALDVVMQTNKITLGEISRILSKGAHKEGSNCAMLLLIAIDQIVTLFECGVKQGSPGDSDRASIGGRDLSALGDDLTGGNVLPNLRFGLFQINQDEQLALRSYLLQRELQRCLQVLTNLRDAIPLEPNPCTALEARVKKLCSAIADSQ
ncbi:hypothetical protein BDV41DRAFT_410629 [Aspergillus transmontanensis]|uniref:Zn(2)-C6 fungal-type domain-containing protein n=1 Tax=Aspergillus transmontanensis TaxID=1034304 RepID=A0A5N6VMV5_9EURO|nr:hypothetical protein BDV41DRAFT_410629 [Aspergillus transmontanensis]